MHLLTRAVRRVGYDVVISGYYGYGSLGDEAVLEQIVASLREKLPDVTVSSDIIVGFPGESEQDFEDTLTMLKKVKFDMLFSFIYSPRKGTPAAGMENPIPREVQQARFDRLLAMQKDIGFEKNQALIGAPMRVLCDGVSKTDPMLYSGRTEGNKIAFFKGTPEDTVNELLEMLK